MPSANRHDTTAQTACTPKHSSGRCRPGYFLLAAMVLALFFGSAATADASGAAAAKSSFPPTLESYGDQDLTSLWDILKNRIEKVSFNLWATLLFFGAVLHAFFTQRFRHIAHGFEHRHKERKPMRRGRVLHVSVPARIFHFLGEVEVVFGIWLVPLFIMMMCMVGVPETMDYLSHRVGYAEPIFVVAIMFVSSTRPILRLAEQCMSVVANLGGGRPVAWWFTILTIGPLLGSLITEPAAMTISASLLARQFYMLKPRLRFAYATLGLLFVNVSIGGTLTNFAAPPVLMVSAPWEWSSLFMLTHFGWLAAVAILVSNTLYLLFFRKDFAALSKDNTILGNKADLPDESIPVWVTAGHLIFMWLTVMCSHYPPLAMICVLFFIAFFELTEDYQKPFSIRSPVLVGFFLAGLVIHGGLQQWWIAPVLGSLSEVPLMFGAIFLTAFNDNAAITFLSTLVPNLSDAMKYAVVAGAVTGGGLTVIANAPNPAGQSILNRYFPEGISPAGLFLGAIIPTAITAALFLAFM